jgi:8-oxo-dGTP pyrophosphatase MutT (NUDIX family)
LLFRTSPQLQFLLMKHATRWDLPKGHVEPGESDLACAVRETQEETGIDPDRLTVHPGFRFETSYEVANWRGTGESAWKTVVIFLAVARHAEEIRPSEHLGHAWVPWSPPHAIQTGTIDPLLREVERHFDDPHQLQWVFDAAEPRDQRSVDR